MLRRNFIKKSVLSVPLLASVPAISLGSSSLQIGLAQWSLHRALQSKKIDNLEFAQIAKEKFDINVVEYVNQFFFDKANNKEYLDQLKTRSEDVGVKNLLIMIDDEGNLGDLNKRKRIKDKLLRKQRKNKILVKEEPIGDGTARKITKTKNGVTMEYYE